MTVGVEGLSRRLFLRGGAAMAFLVAAPAASARSQARKAGALKRSRFTPLVGVQLRMTGGGVDARVVLAEVSDLSPVLRPHDPDRFSLLFRVPRGHHVSPGIRTFHHPHLGRVALFVSPVDRGIKARHFEAVVNRSRS